MGCAEGHGRREHGSHAGHDRLDGVLRPGGLHDEPEEHVHHVDEPDGGVEVEPVAEHELPVGDGLDFERAEGAGEREGKGSGVGESGGEPVDADPVVLGLSDASLSFLDLCHCGIRISVSAKLLMVGMRVQIAYLGRSHSR